MIIQELDIIRFTEHPDLLNNRSLSVGQKMVLKSIYGLPLNPEELELYLRASGRPSYAVGVEQWEPTIIAGRRGGKTSQIGAKIACYEASRDHGLPRGEEAVVMILAPTIPQARIAFAFILGDIRGSRVLAQHIVSSTKEEIKLDNGITIGCYACNYAGVRGRTVVACIGDEVAFWQHDDTSANPDQEVIAAVRPAMATVSRPKLLLISTPYAKEGLLWRQYQQRSEMGNFVLRLSSQELNPTIDPALLEQERLRDEEVFRREYLAEFVDCVNGWIVPELLDPCVVRGRIELPYTPDGEFIAVADPAFVRDDFALAVVRRTREGRIVVHRVVRWSGTKAAPLGCEDVLGQVKSILSEYHLNSVIGDQFCSELIRQQFEKLGIFYRVHNFDARTRPEIFVNLRHLLSQRRIELLDRPELLRQLYSLQEHRTDRGQVDIRPSGGGKDDLAVAVALAASELSKPPTGPCPFLVPEPAPLRTGCTNWAGQPTYTTLNVEPDIGAAIVDGRSLTPEQEDRLLFGGDD